MIAISKVLERTLAKDINLILVFSLTHIRILEYNFWKFFNSLFGLAFPKN